MKTAFGESTTAQLTPVLQEIFPYTVNTRIWTLTQTDATVAFNTNMAELKTEAKNTANAVMVSKKKIKYRTGMGVLARFTALWTTDEAKDYTSYIGIGESDLSNGFYFYKDAVEGFCIAHAKGGVVSYIQQANWDDPCDATGSMPALDWTKGNVFQIQFQYLGFGAIKFSIENPTTGEFQQVHMIKYANANTGVSLRNTTLPFVAVMKNDNDVGIQSLKTASCSMFIEGTNTINSTISNEAEGDKKASTTESPILSIKNKTTFNGGATNYSIVYPTLVSISNEDSKVNIVRIVKTTGTLTGENFADIDATTSIVSKDVSATALGGATITDLIVKLYVNASSSQLIDLGTYNIQLAPGENLTFLQKSVATVANGGNVSVIVNFVEDH